MVLAKEMVAYWQEADLQEGDIASYFAEKPKKKKSKGDILKENKLLQRLADTRPAPELQFTSLDGKAVGWTFKVNVKLHHGRKDLIVREKTPPTSLHLTSIVRSNLDHTAELVQRVKLSHKQPHGLLHPYRSGFFVWKNQNGL